MFIISHHISPFLKSFVAIIINSFFGFHYDIVAFRVGCLSAPSREYDISIESRVDSDIIPQTINASQSFTSLPHKLLSITKHLKTHKVTTIISTHYEN
jgi:hypothetical protein